MPAGDGTGPYGGGPMTGRAMGFCAGSDRPGFANAGAGRFIGWGGGGGRGRGRGYRNWYYATGLPGWMRTSTPRYAWNNPAPMPYNYSAGISREDEINMLKDQADYFKSALDDIQKRLNELDEVKE